MGIVLKQTIKGSLYSYLGVILGALNVALLFPILFSEAEIGLINIFVSISAMLGQISCLGSNGIISYFFPKFEDKISHHNRFFSFIWLYSMLGFAVLSIIFYLIADKWLIERMPDSEILREYSILILPLTFFTLSFLIVDTFASSTLKATLGSFYKELVMRIVNTALIALFYFELIDFEKFLWLYVLNFAIPAMAVYIHLYYKGDISLKLPSLKIYRPHMKSMASIGLFFILNGLSNSIAIYIDKLMITYYIGLRGTGVYSIANFIGTIVRIPRLAMGKISTPIIAQAIKDEDYGSLQKFFRLSVISQVLVGFLIFIPIWINIDIFLSLLPPSYAEGKWVVFFISLSFLVTCFLGIGTQIIQLSSYYKLITYFNLIMGLAIVLLNIVFIPLWGIVGAAFATLISKTVLVILFLYVIRKNFKFVIFMKENYVIILISTLILVGISFIPIFQILNHNIINSIANILIRTIVALSIWMYSMKLLGIFNQTELKISIFKR